MRRQTVRANGLRFHCAVAGDGPLVLLLHGFPQCGYSWRHQLPALAAAGFRAVAPDLRGYGDSDKPSRVSDYSVDRLVEDVGALISAFGEKQAVVVGHDWGGAIAWATALERPELVDRLVVLNCPHPKVFLEALRSNRAQRARSWYMGFFQLPLLPELLLRRGVDRLIAGSSERPEAFTAEDRRVYREAFRKAGAATAALNYYRAAARDGRARRRLAQDRRTIAAPTLLIWGDRDRALGRELTEGLEPLFSGSFRAEHLAEAGHWVHEEQPARVNALLVDFLGAARG